MWRRTGRREFFKRAAALTLAAGTPACVRAGEHPTENKLLKNEDLPGLNVRFYKPFPPVDKAKWKLSVGGLCSNPASFTLEELMDLPKDEQVSRLKCVECWSGKAKWGGFRPGSLFDLVRPDKEARYLYFHSADEYYEYISIEELLRPRVLFVYEMNGEALKDIYGAPLRLIIPFKYGYKNVKTIVELKFAKDGADGYWSRFGYSSDATIQPGSDFALDHEDVRKIEKPGEPEY